MKKIIPLIAVFLMMLAACQHREKDTVVVNGREYYYNHIELKETI